MKYRMTIAVAVASFGVALYLAWGLGKPDDLKRFPKCLHCGMARSACAPTRIYVEYRDGSKRAECSLHCLVAELVGQPGRVPKRTLAADYYHQTLIDAEKCRWVRYENAGGCAEGKMLLAFRSDEEADRFVTSFGGKKLAYDEALASAYRDLGARK